MTSVRGVRVGVAVAAVVAAVAVAAGLAWAVAGRGDEGAVTVRNESPQATAPSPTVPPAPEPEAQAATSTYNPDLDAAYTQCAQERGFDPGGVQVIVQSDRPYWVKTGRDVPARIHEPCFAKIGGPAQRHSSHGYPP